MLDEPRLEVFVGSVDEPAGFALGAFAMSGLLQWLPSYFARAFSMPVAAVGAQFGLCYGLGA
ncbi:hypothetical protein [Phenylobacterium sp.]|uniref:hypothetical protein n=1 Tax=Phenylobacterium sp. TaxID=1871053 RepID=UPI003BA8658F